MGAKMLKKIGKSKSVFIYVFYAMSVLSLSGILILVCCLSVGGVYEKLNQNAIDIIDQKVVNRRSYLQNEMNHNWSDLLETAEKINEIAEELNARGSIRFETLDASSESAAPLIMETVDELIAMMRMKKVTGAYIIFNTHNLDGELEDKPGIYLRDLDPLSRESEKNADILIERAPTEVVRDLNIATDAAWRPRFEFKKTGTAYYDFFYTPYQQAVSNGEKYSVSDMGYWGGKYRLYGTNYDTFTYSVPLINSDGLVYGVMGIDITLDYVCKILPGYELLNAGSSSYLLAITRENEAAFHGVAMSGNACDMDISNVVLNGPEDEQYLFAGDKKFYASVQYLDIYNSNTPYSNQKWALVGMADTRELFVFTDKVKAILLVGILVTLVLEIGGSYFFSYMISRPIRRLTEEVSKAQRKEEVTFSRTNISEIDRFAGTMESLNRDIRETSMKFTNLLQMASIQLAGFEYNADTGALFLSDNFFEIFLDSSVDASKLTWEQFEEKMKKYSSFVISSDYDKKSYVFQIPDGDNFIYVRLRLAQRGNIHTGIAENVTNTVIEKRVIEYERDHDALTGLLNRGALMRIMDDMFKNHKEKLKTAALLMLDLDNLKYLNDNYGHEVGDNYIAKAGRTFGENVPERAVVSRISGDEFYIFFYGYHSEEEIIKQIDRLKLAIDQAAVQIMDNTFKIKVSGGIAWYPRDSRSFEKLQHFADYAMYKIKHTKKGAMTEFDRNEYLRDSFEREMKEEFKTIIEKKTLQFYFQPIISSHTGEIFGYEALMRSFMPSLKSPLEILRIAKEENRLDAVEELTWELALDTFAKHKRNNLISANTKVFINSVSNRILSDVKMKELEENYPEYLKDIVLEVTEGEHAEENIQQKKAEIMKKWGAEIALDDYGSGYNGERMLLLVSPKFIKVDMELIRNIDSHPDKCKIVENIVGYAHERDMKVIAEGIETIEELRQVIRLHVDYLQGFLFSKPQYIPPHVQDELVELIQFLNEGV